MDYIHNKTARFKHVTFPVKPKKEHQYKGNASFQAAMKFPVIMGQFFGLNPVLGVGESDTSKLRFSYFSGRCFYTFVTIFGQVLFLDGLFLVKYFNDNGTSVDSNTSLVFYLTNSSTTILFLRIAKKWPKLCQHIAKTEAADPVMDTTLVRKCIVASIVVILFAAVEHSLAELSGFVSAADCWPDKIYETFLMHSFPWMNKLISYSIIFGTITQFLNIQCTFNWNFSDIFVICISFYLTSRLQQINKRIAAVKGKCVSSTFWRSIREDYNRVTNLVRRVDEVIGSIVFISFANNLFFICLQLLHTLADGIKSSPGCHIPDQRLFNGYEGTAYFTYSLVFLIVRSLAVCLIASEVNTASRQPVYALYEVPSNVYCIEVQRFIEQIHSETVALSGLQFFYVKRGMVLATVTWLLLVLKLYKTLRLTCSYTIVSTAFSLCGPYKMIAGTIVTYELVLLQFTGVTPTVGPLHSEDDLI